MTTEAPLTTAAELLTRPETRETLVHFVNFDRKNPLSPFKVTVRKQFAGKVDSVTFLSPDLDDPSTIEFEETGDTVSFTVPSMRIYSMIVIAQGN